MERELLNLRMSKSKKIASLLLTPVWWNPLFWIAVIILTPFSLLFEGWGEWKSDIISLMKDVFKKP